MAKKHQYKISNKETRRRAGRKWRRAMRQQLRISLGDKPYKSPSRAVPVKNPGRDSWLHRILADLENITP